ncbi:hypothetical protein V8F33_000646 [Rhypophila sp. PSN 637]
MTVARRRFSFGRREREAGLILWTLLIMDGTALARHEAIDPRSLYLLARTTQGLSRTLTIHYDSPSILTAGGVECGRSLASSRELDLSQGRFCRLSHHVGEDSRTCLANRNSNMKWK